MAEDPTFILLKEPHDWLNEDQSTNLLGAAIRRCWSPFTASRPFFPLRNSSDVVKTSMLNIDHSILAANAFMAKDSELSLRGYFNLRGAKGDLEKFRLHGERIHITRIQNPLSLWLNLFGSYRGLGEWINARLRKQNVTQRSMDKIYWVTGSMTCHNATIATLDATTEVLLHQASLVENSSPNSSTATTKSAREYICALEVHQVVRNGSAKDRSEISDGIQARDLWYYKSRSAGVPFGCQNLNDDEWTELLDEYDQYDLERVSATTAQDIESVERKSIIMWQAPQEHQERSRGLNVPHSATSGLQNEILILLRKRLCSACLQGQLELCQALISQIRAMTDLSHSFFGLLLILAASSGCGSIVLYVLGMDANIDTRTTNGSTPLIAATKHDYHAIVEILTSAGANVDCTDRDGKTALMYACENGFSTCVKHIVNAPGDLNQEDFYGRTALTYACRSGYLDIVRLLVDHGADQHHRSDCGMSPLHTAFTSGCGHIVQYLLGQPRQSPNESPNIETICKVSSRAIWKVMSTNSDYSIILNLTHSPARITGNEQLSSKQPDIMYCIFSEVRNSIKTNRERCIVDDDELIECGEFDWLMSSSAMYESGTEEGPKVQVDITESATAHNRPADSSRLLLKQQKIMNNLFPGDDFSEDISESDKLGSWRDQVFRNAFISRKFFSTLEEQHSLKPRDVSLLYNLNLMEERASDVRMKLNVSCIRRAVGLAHSVELNWRTLTDAGLVEITAFTTSRRIQHTAELLTIYLDSIGRICEDFYDFVDELLYNEQMRTVDSTARLLNSIALLPKELFTPSWSSPQNYWDRLFNTYRDYPSDNTRIERIKTHILYVISRTFAILDLVIVSHAAAHRASQLEAFLGLDFEFLSEITILISDCDQLKFDEEIQDSRLVRRSLTCVSQFLSGEDVMVWKQSQIPDRLLSIRPLSVLCTAESFASAWGEVAGFVQTTLKSLEHSSATSSETPEQFDHFRTYGGFILPLNAEARRTGVSRKSGPRLCHWVSEQDYWHWLKELDPNAQSVAQSTFFGPKILDETGMFDEFIGSYGLGHSIDWSKFDHVSRPMTRKQKLLIGCSNIAQLREFPCPSEPPIATLVANLRGNHQLVTFNARPPHKYIEGSLGFTAGKYVTIGGQFSLKQDKGLSGKEALIFNWHTRPKARDPIDLERRWGVIVSLWTFNAIRVRIRDLLCTETLQAFIQTYQWSSLIIRDQFIAALKSSETNAFRSLWQNSNTETQEEFGNILFDCLTLLADTGLRKIRQGIQDGNRFYIAWKPESGAHIRNVVLEEADCPWVRFLSDRENSSTMAVGINEVLCLDKEFSYGRRRYMNDARLPLLETSLCLNPNILPPDIRPKDLRECPDNLEHPQWPMGISTANEIWPVERLLNGKVCRLVVEGGYLKVIRAVGTWVLLTSWSPGRQRFWWYDSSNRKIHYEFDGTDPIKRLPVPVHIR